VCRGVASNGANLAVNLALMTQGTPTMMPSPMTKKLALVRDARTPPDTSQLGYWSFIAFLLAEIVSPSTPASSTHFSCVVRQSQVLLWSVAACVIHVLASVLHFIVSFKSAASTWPTKALTKMSANSRDIRLGVVFVTSKAFTRSVSNLNDPSSHNGCAP